MTTPPKYLLYVRQSITGDRDESLSLAFQERALRGLVERENGIVIEPPVIDADQRGWDPNRPGIAELFERIEREQPDVIGVYAMSRFARDAWLQEGLWRKAKLLQPKIKFASVTEPHADDDMVRGLLGVISQAERKRMGAFLKSAFAENARRGKPHGRVPFGFVKGEDGRLVIDPEGRDWILQMLDRFEAGWSLWRIANWLNDEQAGGRRWEPNIVRNTINSVAIAGGIKCGEVLQWACHEPIIDMTRYERIRALAESRRYIRTKRASSWLEGLVRCSCGAPMDLCRITHPNPTIEIANFRCTASPSQKAFQRRRNWPVCQTRPRSITKAKAERLTIEALIDAFDHIRGWQEVAADHRRKYTEGQTSQAMQRTRLERDLTKAERERERLLILYKRGTLDVARWEAEDRALADRICGLETALAETPAPPPDDELKARAAALRTLGEHVRLIAVAEPERLRDVLQSRGATVRLIPGGLRIEWPEEIAAFLGGDGER